MAFTITDLAKRTAITNAYNNALLTHNWSQVYAAIYDAMLVPFTTWVPEVGDVTTLARRAE
jgi:hypothetical protein